MTSYVNTAGTFEPLSGRNIGSTKNFSFPALYNGSLTMRSPLIFKIEKLVDYVLIALWTAYAIIVSNEMLLNK